MFYKIKEFFEKKGYKVIVVEPTEENVRKYLVKSPGVRAIAYFGHGDDASPANIGDVTVDEIKRFLMEKKLEDRLRKDLGLSEGEIEQIIEYENAAGGLKKIKELLESKGIAWKKYIQARKKAEEEAEKGLQLDMAYFHSCYSGSDEDAMKFYVKKGGIFWGDEDKKSAIFWADKHEVK